MPRPIIFVNGELPDFGAARLLIQPDDIIIAADGGARHALQLGIVPNVILGDLDSLSEPEVRAFTDMGVHILRFPTAKDETDLELAFGHALKAGYHPIIIIGAYGGRLDQSLANIALLADPEAAFADVRLDDGITETILITSKATLHGKPGETISLIPWGAPVEGVTTEGLVYPLNRATLLPYRTRGVSNQMLSDTARIIVKRGILVCVHIRNI